MSIMRTNSLLGLLALVGAFIVFAGPASAEFFTCNQRPGQLLYSYTGTPDQYIRRQRRTSTPRYSSSYSRSYSSRSQRRHATYSSDPRYWNGR